jgi:plastocyanin
VKARAAAAGIALALAGCGPAATAPHSYQIVIDKMAFGPLPATLRAGDTIVWINRDIFQHSATAQDGSFDLDLPAGKSGKTVLHQAGTIHFSCKYHPGMQGMLRVQ